MRLMLSLLMLAIVVPLHADDAVQARVRVALALAESKATCRTDFDAVRREAIAAHAPIAVYVGTEADGVACTIGDDGMCIPVTIASYVGDKPANPEKKRIVILSPGNPAEETGNALYVRKTLSADAKPAEIKQAVDNARKSSGNAPGVIDWFSDNNNSSSSAKPVAKIKLLTAVKVPAAGWHIHRCSAGHEWSHTDASLGDPVAHTCPVCGRQDWDPKERGKKIEYHESANKADLEEDVPSEHEDEMSDEDGEPIAFYGDCPGGVCPGTTTTRRSRSTMSMREFVPATPAVPRVVVAAPTVTVVRSVPVTYSSVSTTRVHRVAGDRHHFFSRIFGIFFPRR